MEKTIEIPEGYKARIEGNKVILESKESEDERIRNLLYCLIRDRRDNWTLLEHNGVSVNMALAWIEKQGEQNLANSEKTCKVEPKFKVGDVVVEIKPNGYCPPVRVKYIDKGAYSCKSDDGKRFLSFPIISQDEYKLVEQNHAWTEEDEKIKQDIENLIHFALKDGSVVYPAADTTKEDALDWLKSIKARYTWMPSDEQIISLSTAIAYCLGDKEKTELKSLLDDLKKLKG